MACCIKSRLPRWRGGTRKRSRPPSRIHPHAASFSSVRNTHSSLPLSPSDMSSRTIATQIASCPRRGGFRSSHSQCGAGFPFISFQPSLDFTGRESPKNNAVGATHHDWREKNLYSPSSLTGIKASPFSTVSMDLSEQHIYRMQPNQSEIMINPWNMKDTSSDIQQQSSSRNDRICHELEDPHIAPNTPLPEPLPEPLFSFRGRALPPNLLAFNSTEGKGRFLASLVSNHAEAYFPLSQQFLNQMDPAFCGISTLILILNALAMDPNVRWRGGWRWYGDESMLLERCCLEEERVAREGITLEQFCGLARCHGVGLVTRRPELPVDDNLEKDGGEEGQQQQHKGKGYGGPHGHAEETFGVEQFRRDVINAVRHPPRTQWEDDAEAETESQSTKLRDRSTGGCFITISFARHALQQTGDGHFSPIAAYHPPTDSCLVLDVARFKYAPYWVSVTDLYDAMKPLDKSTGKPRGWVLMYPPPPSKKRNGKPMSTKELEGQRPAACVPLAGSGERICPVEQIKVDFCSVCK